LSASNNHIHQNGHDTSSPCNEAEPTEDSNSTPDLLSIGRQGSLAISTAIDDTEQTFSNGRYAIVYNMNGIGNHEPDRTLETAIIPDSSLERLTESRSGTSSPLHIDNDSVGSDEGGSPAVSSDDGNTTSKLPSHTREANTASLSDEPHGTHIRGHTNSSEQSSTKRASSAPKRQRNSDATSNSKRLRPAPSDDAKRGDDDQNDPKDPSNLTPKVTRDDELACLFAKNDPKTHRLCWGRTFPNISELRLV
jgi:hypothetical protein